MAKRQREDSHRLSGLETMVFNGRETLTHFVSRRAAVLPQCNFTWRNRPCRQFLGAAEEF